MNNKIENPKVFISYAWGSEEYQAKVLSLASELVGDGIEVVLDKWDLSEGNDTYAFMEKCVTDKSITNVLMLLDPIYAEKADGRRGGVGTETQIISSEVYGKVDQNKFIPIVFERTAEGNICKPTYLKALLHFDLSKEECFDNEYQRLVKRLYGIEIYVKPTLGKKPEWVEANKQTSIKIITKYEKIKKLESSLAKKELFYESLEEIKDLLMQYVPQELLSSQELGDYLKAYDGMRNIRDAFLDLLPCYLYVDDSNVIIGNFMEEIQNTFKSSNDLSAEIKRVLVHELFIYIIAFQMKKKDFKSVGYLLGRTYFNDRYNEAENYTFFYSASDHSNLDRAVCNRDKKNYYSGTASHWIETLSNVTCSKNDFVLADLICYNYSILGANFRDPYAWFPMLYPYGGGIDNDSTMRAISTRMQSREFLSKLILLFGYRDIDRFIAKFKEAEQNTNWDEYRYPSAFNSAPTLLRLIKSEKLGVLP